MRVAVIGPSPPLRGGVAAHTAGLRRVLEAAGHSCDVLSFARLYPRALFPGRSQYVDGPHACVDAVIDTMRPATWIDAGRRLARLRPDLVVVQWWHPVTALAVRTALACARLGVPVVFICHNAHPHEPLPGGRGIARLALARADAVLCHSRDVAERVAKGGLRSGSQLEVAPMPLLIDPDRPLAARARARAHIGVDPSTRLAVFAGHVRAYKGVDVLLEAWARARLPADALLLIAGEWYLRGRRRERLRGAGAAMRVRVVDRYLDEDELVAVVAAADVLVLPYRTASQSGLAPLAAALGVPLLTSDAGGLPEQLVEHARARGGEGDRESAPVPAGDPGRLAAALAGSLAGERPAAARQEAPWGRPAGRRDPNLMSRSWRPTVAALERLAALRGGAREEV